MEFLTPALGAATAAEVEAALPSLLRRLDDAQLGAAFGARCRRTRARARVPTGRFFFLFFPAGPRRAARSARRPRRRSRPRTWGPRTSW